MCLCKLSSVSTGVCLSSSTTSRACVCNGSDPGSANSRCTPRGMCVCTRDQGWVWVCVCICHVPSPVDSYLCLCVFMYMLTPLNDCDYVRQVILVLIMKYFALTIVSYSHATTLSNLFNKQSANSSRARKSPTVHTR